MHGFSMPKKVSTTSSTLPSTSQGTSSGGSNTSTKVPKWFKTGRFLPRNNINTRNIYYLYALLCPLKNDVFQKINILIFN